MSVSDRFMYTHFNTNTQSHIILFPFQNIQLHIFKKHRFTIEMSQKGSPKTHDTQNHFKFQGQNSCQFGDDSDKIKAK